MAARTATFPIPESPPPSADGVALFSDFGGLRGQGVPRTFIVYVICDGVHAHVDSHFGSQRLRETLIAISTLYAASAIMPRGQQANRRNGPIGVIDSFTLRDRLNGIVDGATNPSKATSALLDPGAYKKLHYTVRGIKKQHKPCIKTLAAKSPVLELLIDCSANHDGVINYNDLRNFFAHYCVTKKVEYYGLPAEAVAETIASKFMMMLPDLGKLMRCRSWLDHLSRTVEGDQTAKVVALVERMQRTRAACLLDSFDFGKTANVKARASAPPPCEDDFDDERVDDDG